VCDSGWGLVERNPVRAFNRGPQDRLCWAPRNM